MLSHVSRFVQVIMDYEVHQRRGGRKTSVHRFDVMLTSYEALRDNIAVFQGFTWDAVVVDEAHRLKGIKSQFRSASLHRHPTPLPSEIVALS